MNPNLPPSTKPKHAWVALDRVEPPKRPATDRLSDFRQTQLPYDEATAIEQASRCIQCPDPVCVAACPHHAPLVEALRLTANSQLREAAELIFVTQHIPEIASHTCVGGRCCERACVLSGKTDPVPIRAITRFLLDYGWKHGLAEPPVEPAKGQSVAVIGSGIGGLVAADALSRRGYAVTVFDSRQIPGGRVMNGLPGFRVDKDLVVRRLGLLRQRGIQFRMGVSFGQDVKLNELRRDFDAVFVGFGRAESVPLQIPGAALKGVYQALPFICQNTPCTCGPSGSPNESKAVEPKPAEPSIEVRGKRVVVLGGGDTAMDVLRIAMRNGAASAVCLYRRDLANLPADAEEYVNAEEEGARFKFLCQAVAVVGNAAGQVTHVRCVRMELDGPDNYGRTNVQPIRGSEFEVPADVVFAAYGYVAPKLPRTEDFALLKVDAQSQVVVDANRMTNLSGVFAGGSVVRNTSPLSAVVNDAREAAAAIDGYLGARRGECAS